MACARRRRFAASAGSFPFCERLKRAGTSFREVRSPEAPKITTVSGCAIGVSRAGRLGAQICEGARSRGDAGIMLYARVARRTEEMEMLGERGRKPCSCLAFVVRWRTISGLTPCSPSSG